MSGSESLSNGPEILDYTDENRTIVIQFTRFETYNRMYSKAMGQSMFEDSATDPNRVYNYLRATINAWAGSTTVNATVTGQDTALKKQKTLELFEELLPPDYEGSRTVRVAIRPSTADLALSIADPIEVLELRVNPPNYAG